MMITRKSSITGITRTLNIPVSKQAMDEWQAGLSIDLAMPNLSAEHIDFILSGITADEWNTAFRSVTA